MIQTIAEQGLPPMSVFAWSFLDEYVKDDKFAIKVPVASWIKDAITKREMKSLKWLVGRCKSLLETQTSTEWRSEWRNQRSMTLVVNVAHRSVYDFLQKEEIQQLMRSRLCKYSTDTDFEKMLSVPTADNAST